MDTNEMIAKITTLQELKRLRDELDAEIESAQDEIKVAMGDTETGVFGPYKVTYKPVISNRLDTTAIKKAFPAETLAPYMRASTSRPLKIS